MTCHVCFWVARACDTWTLISSGKHPAPPQGHGPVVFSFSVVVKSLNPCAIGDLFYFCSWCVRSCSRMMRGVQYCFSGRGRLSGHVLFLVLLALISYSSANLCPFSIQVYQQKKAEVRRTLELVEYHQCIRAWTANLTSWKPSTGCAVTILCNTLK